MKILITGASGLLGNNFTLAAAQRADSVTAVYFRQPKLALVGAGGVDALVDRVRPDRDRSFVKLLQAYDRFQIMSRS
jgi:nucleoside-diphosphate-sugar epimerase